MTIAAISSSFAGNSNAALIYLYPLPKIPRYLYLWLNFHCIWLSLLLLSLAY